MITIGVMAVLARKEQAWALEDQLRAQGADVFISFDAERRGPWWNWRETAHIALHVQAVEHVVILQDDVVPCPNFVASLHRLVCMAPDVPLVLFTARKSILGEAVRRGTHLLPRTGLDTAQALVFPRALLQSFLDWSASPPDAAQAWGQHDDSWLDGWSRHTRTRFVYALPTLVDHNIELKSTLGHSPRTAHGLRVSPELMGNDGATFDWRAKR